MKIQDIDIKAHKPEILCKYNSHDLRLQCRTYPSGNVIEWTLSKRVSGKWEMLYWLRDYSGGKINVKDALVYACEDVFGRDIEIDSETKEATI